MKRGYCAVGLVGCKTESNYGGAMRSAIVFDVAMVEIVGARFHKQSSDVSRSWRKIPVLVCESPIIPFDCVPVAVELGGKDLRDYQHPGRAIYFFGPEDGGLSSTIVQACRDRVTIPGRYCLNLASSVSILLYDRESKRRDLGLPEQVTRAGAAR